MKSIMGLSKAMFLFSLAVVLATGCGDPKKASSGGDRVARPAGGGRNAGPTANQAGGAGGVPANPQTATQNGWGQITSMSGQVLWGNDSLGYLNENEVVRLFVSTNLDPQYVGATDMKQDPMRHMECQYGQTCTLVINMPMSLPTSLSQAINSGQQVPINQGQINIIMYDSLVGTPSPDDGMPMTPFPIRVNIRGGTLTRNQFHAEFADDMGVIIADGNISQNMIYGQLSFANNTSFEGGDGGARGILGTFSVPTCSVFQPCN